VTEIDGVDRHLQPQARRRAIDGDALVAGIFEHAPQSRETVAEGVDPSHADLAAGSGEEGRRCALEIEPRFTQNVGDALDVAENGGRASGRRWRRRGWGSGG
jgi:hypothetical protein